MRGVTQDRCVRRTLLEDPETFIAIRSMWIHYNNGFLPYGGGYMEQPAKWLDAMEVFSVVHGMAQEAKSSKTTPPAPGGGKTVSVLGRD